MERTEIGEWRVFRQRDNFTGITCLENVSKACVIACSRNFLYMFHYFSHQVTKDNKKDNALFEIRNEPFDHRTRIITNCAPEEKKTYEIQTKCRNSNWYDVRVVRKRKSISSY